MHVGLLVGHIGPGTGAVYGDRDEWTLARRIARETYARLMHADFGIPAYFEINRAELRWRILGDLLDDKSDDTIKANWLREIRADVVIDFHFNSADDARAHGHEIIVPRMSEFAKCIAAAMDMLPNRRRDPIINNGFRLFRRLESTGIDPVIIEPAFIWEPDIDTSAYARRVADHLVWGIERYARGDIDVEVPPDGT